MQLYLLTSTNRRQQISEVSSFEEATQLVKELDQQYEEWEATGFTTDPFPPVLNDWEGCDVYLEDSQRTWMFTIFGWQDLRVLQKKEA